MSTAELHSSFPQADRKYMPLPAAAAYAGVSEKTIRRWTKARRLTAYRPCGRIVILQAELAEVIAASADEVAK